MDRPRRSASRGSSGSPGWSEARSRAAEVDPVAIVDSITLGCVVAGHGLGSSASAVGLMSWIEVRSVSAGEVRALWGGAIAMVLLAVVLTQRVFVPGFVGIDEREQLMPDEPAAGPDPEDARGPVDLRRVIWVDAAIAASTFLVVLQVRSAAGASRRRRPERDRSSVAGSSPNSPGGDSSG